MDSICAFANNLSMFILSLVGLASYLGYYMPLTLY